MEFDQIIEQLQEDFAAIHMARPPYVLEHMVVGAHEHPAQQWAHCVLEMKIKYNAIRRAKLRRRQLQLRIEKLEAQAESKAQQDRPAEAEILRLRAAELAIDIEEQDSAELGAVRELEALYAIYEGFGRRYTRDELNEAQPDYWHARITGQAERDLLATGRVSQSNQDALRQIGAAWPGQNAQIAGTEQRYLSAGNRRLLVVVPTERQAVEGLPVLDDLVIPSGIEFKPHNIFGLPVADAYNQAALMAMRESTDYLLTVEDDTFPPADGLARLLAHDLDAVGGWYRKRAPVYEGVPIVIENGQRQGLNDPDGQLREVYTLPQGFTLYKTAIFERVKFPWFVTTGQLSQDSYFSQQCREAGVRLWCDTAVRCAHVDRVTGERYE